MKLLRIIVVGAIVVLCLISFSLEANEVDAQTNSLAVPAESDWVDHGQIFANGATGEWDDILWGGFAGCVTKMDGTFYLYYQGSDGYDEAAGTVTNRAIGLATSSDGLNFQKHANNPILTYAPNDNIEEGAVSCGVSLEDGELAMFYGANRAANSTSIYVHANGIAATSPDGLTFNDQGVALRYDDSTLWGSGDEVFPVMSLKAPETNQWIVYYIPNGVNQSRLLGVAWGNGMLNLSNSAGVTAPNGSNIATWGMGGGVVSLNDGSYAVFTNDVSTKTMEARIMDPNSPDQLSEPVQTYNFSDFSSGVVYFDEASNTWYLFYRDGNSSAYGVKTATASEPVNQPPTASAGQDTTVELQNGSATVTLTGSASDDGLPNPPGATTATWSLVSGPASVAFADPNSLNTTATMTAEGSYVLELRVSDGELSATDTVTITVEAGSTVPTCQVNSAEWNRNSAANGQKVQLKAFATDCLGGETVNFDIYEVMAGSQDPLLVTSRTTTMGNNNQARVDWTASYNCDEPGIDCPAPEDSASYYFVVYLADSPTHVTTSPLLPVTSKYTLYMSVAGNSTEREKRLVQTLARR